MTRTFDSEEVNRVANSKSVRETMFLGAVFPLQELDFDAWVSDNRNVCLIDAGFCAVFVFRGPGIYECHLMVEKAERGANAFRVGKRMLDFMKDYGASIVWGQPSVYNRQAICYIRRMGLKPCGFGQDKVAGDVQYFMVDL